jgi:hypothetical protein
MASLDSVTHPFQLPLAAADEDEDDHDDDRRPIAADEDVENDPDRETMDDSASIDLCIELGFADMIDVNEDRSLDPFINIDPFLAIDNFVD